MVARPHGREEDKTARPGALRGPDEAQRGHRVQLLDRAAGLVARGGPQVEDGVDAAEGVPEGGGLTEVAERDLDAHPLVAKAARIADEAAHRLGCGGQPPQQRRAHGAGRAREQYHRRPPRPLAPKASVMARLASPAEVI